MWMFGYKMMDILYKLYKGVDIYHKQKPKQPGLVQSSAMENRTSTWDKVNEECLDI